MIELSVTQFTFYREILLDYHQLVFKASIQFDY